jgi:hypothetical protein
VPIDTLAQDLALTFPWIGRNVRRVEALCSLLEEAEAAQAQHGPSLVGRLLERFTFLSAEEYEELLLEIAYYVDATFDLDRTILCATTADRHKDSAQLILYDLVSTLAGIGRYKIRALNRYDGVASEKNFAAVLLVDEFIGSGRTFSGRARNLRRIFRDKGQAAPAIHGIALAGMTQALRSIAGEFDSLNVCLALSKGIKDHSPITMRAADYSVMGDLEAILAPDYEGDAMPTLGYASSEALYSRHGGSCPNNVFPVFWWPQRKGPVDRRPMFPRAL